MNSSWINTTIGGFLTLQRGHDLTASERRDGQIPVMGAAGQNGCHDTPKVDGPGIVVGRSGASFGQVHFCRSDFWPHNTALYVSDYKGNDIYYAYYLLKNLDFNRLNSGSAQPSLNRNFVYPVRIRVPRPNEQRKIASVLANLDAKIELNHRINQELEGLAKLLYDYWFVQFDFPISAEQAAAMGDPTLQGKPYRQSGGKMTYNPTLKREIPVGWEAGTAKDLFVFNPTISIRKGKISAYLDMDALPTSGFMTKRIQRKEFNGGTKFINGDVLVARITPCLENGKTGLVTLLEEGEPAFGSTEFIVLRGRHMPLSGFGCCLSRSVYFRKYAVGNMTGTSGRKRLEAPILEKLPLSIPPTNILAAFEKVCHPLFTLMTEHTKQNQELATLRDWLLPMLMNGQVTVAP